MADPNVIVKGGEVVQSERVMALNEVESIEKSLGAHKQMIGATDASYTNANEGAAPVLPPGYRVNKQRLSDQAQQMQKALEKGRPREIPSADKDRFVRRAKFLEDKFRDYLETRAEIHVMKRDRAEWQSAIEKARKRPELEAYITEWQSIQRRLEPGNPDAGNLHTLRKDR